MTSALVDLCLGQCYATSGTCHAIECVDVCGEGMVFVGGAGIALSFASEKLTSELVPELKIFLLHK